MDHLEIILESFWNNFKTLKKIQKSSYVWPPVKATSDNCFPELQATEEQTLVHAPPQYQ